MAKEEEIQAMVDAVKLIGVAGKDLPGSPVNHPSHYNHGGMEVIDICDAVIEATGADGKQAARIFNVVKYICRYPFKGKPVEDLEKARWYLDELIKEVEGNDHVSGAETNP